MAADAKRVVLLGTVGTGVLGAVGYARRKGTPPPTRLVAGVFIVGAILAGLAEVAPDIAAGVAGLALVTSVFVVGADAWKGIAAST